MNGQLLFQETTDQASWDAFIAAQPHAAFTQAWSWGELQRQQGHEVRRFAVCDQQGIILACQLQHQKRRASGYWFAPRGPALMAAPTADQRQLIKCFLTELLKRRLPGPAMFYRFEPQLLNQTAAGILPSSFRRSHAVNPACVHVLDISPSSAELLSAMHEKTRYNIRLAERHGVTVRLGSAADMPRFLELIQETSERDRILAHRPDYLRATFDQLASVGMAQLRLAEYQGKVLAANMEIRYGDTVTYLHGSSSNASRQVMAPFALQWAAIQAARQDGYRWYDFGGCNPASKASFYYKPSWQGITRFKQGWGGETIHWLGTWDLPIQPLLYRLAFLKGAFRG